MKIKINVSGELDLLFVYYMNVCMYVDTKLSLREKTCATKGGAGTLIFPPLSQTLRPTEQSSDQPTNGQDAS